MTDVLDKIDASLEEVEEQLLAEFRRLRKGGTDERFVKLDDGIRNALSEITDILHEELQNSGRGTLSLVTDRHEVLYSRIAILRHLFTANIRPGQLVEAHEGVKERRQRLEERVIAERQKADPAVSRLSEEKKKPGLLSSLKGLFDHTPTEQEIERNVINVTPKEEDRLEDTAVYLDNGIYSASRELSMLASLTRGGTLDRPPEEAEGTDAPKPGKAVFEARDLRYHAPPPERVSRPRSEKEPEPEPEPEPGISKRDIAQTPEEIRRKLEARRGQQSAAGKASFEAKDLSTSTYSEPPRPRSQPAPAQEERDADSASPRTGKAVFVAKDIDPVAPQEPPRRRPKAEDEKKKSDDDKAEEKRNGPAVFEARDLTTPPFPKKD